VTYIRDLSGGLKYIRRPPSADGAMVTHGVGVLEQKRVVCGSYFINFARLFSKLNKSSPAIRVVRPLFEFSCESFEFGWRGRWRQLAIEWFRFDIVLVVELVEDIQDFGCRLSLIIGC
jgi:hypothetical protein